MQAERERRSRKMRPAAAAGQAGLKDKDPARDSKEVDVKEHVGIDNDIDGINSSSHWWNTNANRFHLRAGDLHAIPDEEHTGPGSGVIPFVIEETVPAILGVLGGTLSLDTRVQVAVSDKWPYAGLDDKVDKVLGQMKADEDALI